MAAARFDILLEEHSDLTFEFTYRDADGNANDLTNWGAAILLAEDDESKPFYVGYAGDADQPILVGGANGLIELQVPYTYYDNLNIKKGYWELYIYPTAGDATDRPKRLLFGEFKYKKSLFRYV